jgi:hypothetical protein
MTPNPSDNRTTESNDAGAAHLDSEAIALLALGEAPATRDDGQHLSMCLSCRSEVDRLGEAAQLARTTLGDGALIAPSDAVWSSIQRELGMTSPAPIPFEVDQGSGRSRGRRLGRHRIQFALVAAVTAGLLVGGGILAGQLRGQSGDLTTIARADLAALPAWPTSSGQARITASESGERLLVITIEAPDPDGAVHEVWLLTREVDGLVSLGLLQGATGQFVIPHEIDLGDFPVVDVSLEPLDGDPGHSGDSIVRGELSA